MAAKWFNSLDTIEAEKAVLRAMIENKLTEYETLARTSLDLSQFIPEAQEATPRSPPPKERNPASQEWKPQSCPVE